MTTLQQISQANSEWDLEAFVQVANDLLPQYLPASADPRSRSSEAVNPRLVRYYTTQGVLDRPARQGREARYTYRHLLQLLVVRRLLVEGYSTTAIQPITIEKSDVELEALLQGGIQITVEAANPALAFLQSVKARKAPSSPAPPSPDSADQTSNQLFNQPTSSRSAPAPSKRSFSPGSPASESFAERDSQPNQPEPVSRWRRIEILPGLEVQVRDDFVPPSTPKEHENLLQLIAQRLKPLFQSRRSSP
ncbi:MAG: MerR family transcriptional regulator [Thainema sp.]